MSSSSEDENADPFKFKDCVQVTNKNQKLSVTIQPKLRKELGGKTFTKIDIYQSRGIRALLACKIRATSKEIRAGVGLHKV